MSYARNWAGKVNWCIDNKCVIEKIGACQTVYIANDWSKMGDSDVFEYINRMQDVVAGVWNVKHWRGHVEGRETDQREWTKHNEERSNVEADHICGRARKMALSDQIMWLEKRRMSGVLGVRSWRRNI
jgi:hypothetical protein